MACDCESRPVRMATLLKRWKMRMLGKYKHLSGMATDSECRRSEASLRSAAATSCCSGPAAADTRPAAQHCQGGGGSCASFPRSSRRRRPAAVIPTPEPPEQPGRPAANSEFSFTVYDLDGRGQVTQDDIAGLVRTIYDLVGSSMDMPSGGGRTINVRLTVSPEQPPPPPPPPAGVEVEAAAAAGRRAPMALPSGSAGYRSAPATSPVTSELTPQCRPRHPVMEPPAKRHLTELLRDSMEKNNVTYNNVVSYSNLKRSHTCRDHVRHVSCRPVETENHYCTVGELYCPNVAAAGRRRRRASLRRAAVPSARQQQLDDYDLLTRCAEFSLRAEEAARQRSRRGGGPAGEVPPPPPPPPRAGRPVQHHHRHEHVHQHYHHYTSDVLIL